MAGTPKRNAVLAALHVLAVEHFEDPSASALDYAVQWLESGRTMTKLAERLWPLVGFEAHSSLVLLGLRTAFGEPAVTEALARAREKSADAMVEDTFDIADEAAGTPALAAQARNRIAARQWLAERRNKALQIKTGASVHVSLGVAYLDALRVPAPVPAIPSAIAEDAQVLSIEPATT